MILLYVTMSCINTRSFLLCKRYREYNISVLLQMPFFGLSEVPHEKVVTLFFQPKKNPKGLQFVVRLQNLLLHRNMLTIMRANSPLLRPYYITGFEAKSDGEPEMQKTIN